MISRDINNLHTVKIDTKVTTQTTVGAKNLDLKGTACRCCFLTLILRDVEVKKEAVGWIAKRASE